MWIYQNKWYIYIYIYIAVYNDTAKTHFCFDVCYLNGNVVYRKRFFVFDLTEKGKWRCTIAEHIKAHNAQLKSLLCKPNYITQKQRQNLIGTDHVKKNDTTPTPVYGSMFYSPVRTVLIPLLGRDFSDRIEWVCTSFIVKFILVLWLYSR